jgi:hypothetical protein
MGVSGIAKGMNRWIAGCDASSCRTDKTDGRVSERVPMRRVVQNTMKGTAQKRMKDEGYRPEKEGYRLWALP